MEKADVALFRSLSGPLRVVVDARAILPRWLAVVPDPLSFGRRRLWLTAKGLPLRGWHVQQMRKIAMAGRLAEDGAIFCDSDTVFVRETDLSGQWTDGRFTFYRNEGAIQPRMTEHRAWSERAGRLLGIAPSVRSRTDYISQSVGWRTDTVRAMIGRIEAATGRGWAAALAADRRFSECMIYGRFVDEIENRPDRHAPSDRPICHSYWMGSAWTRRRLPPSSGTPIPGSRPSASSRSSGPTSRSSARPRASPETAFAGAARPPGSRPVVIVAGPAAAVGPAAPGPSSPRPGRGDAS